MTQNRMRKRTYTAFFHCATTIRSVDRARVLRRASSALFSPSQYFRTFPATFAAISCPSTNLVLGPARSISATTRAHASWGGGP